MMQTFQKQKVADLSIHLQRVIQVLKELEFERFFVSLSLSATMRHEHLPPVDDTTQQTNGLRSPLGMCGIVHRFLLNYILLKRSKHFSSQDIDASAHI